MFTCEHLNVVFENEISRGRTDRCANVKMFPIAKLLTINPGSTKK